MKKFEKIFIIFAILLLNFSVANAEERYSHLPIEAKNIFDEIARLDRTKADVEKNIEIIYTKLNQVYEKFPENPEVLKEIWNETIWCNVRIEKFDEARKILNDYYKLDSNNADVYNCFGLLEAGLKNYEKSNQYYEKVLQLATRKIRKSIAENNIGVNYHNQKNFSEAIKHYTKSIEYCPTAWTYKNRGEIFADEMKDYSTAIMDYNKAIELDGKDLYAYWERADAHYNLKNYSAALKDYKKVLELDNTKNNLYFSIGYCYYELKNYSAAVNAYTKYLYYFPDDKSAYNNRGNACRRLGDYATAIANFTQAILIDSSYGMAYYNRGVCYEEMGRTEQAEQDYQRARMLGYYG